MKRYRHILCGEHCLTNNKGRPMVPGTTRHSVDWDTPDGKSLTLPYGFIRCAACGNDLHWNFQPPYGVKEMPA